MFYFRTFLRDTKNQFHIILTLQSTNEISMYSDSLFAQSHWLTFERLWLMATCTSWRDLPDTVNVVSSANGDWWRVCDCGSSYCLENNLQFNKDSYSSMLTWNVSIRISVELEWMCSGHTAYLIEVHYRFVVWAVQYVFNSCWHSKSTVGLLANKVRLNWRTAVLRIQKSESWTTSRRSLMLFHAKNLNTATLAWKKELTYSMFLLINQTS